ncbi:rhomboid family intramembrane serine protease [Laspinema olomoucense]|uniref:Rhomboid family intramembrane serine protease n=1 Tax=Laspinema olomoucense D3b TaxID=2953688 RepID=A0ABT2N7Z5_9CYAN|nr:MULTISPECIES: rhomboid family intramembrane serine protease [unclassified Laspinema]MCT7978821.1 rhomboid family intramembrane serine protease [Laspinema sp. D3b]MCT7989501.1 rhomboid family intramembrane serine protease [Laspinema sp. D3a]MCT7997057.1 rhomboid family intramembrane serine protease [Laspinema sp. D3c]
MSRNNVKAIADTLKTQILILGGFVTLMWIVQILNLFLFRGTLLIYGILPRHPDTLRGILFMPFLHGNFPHLIANTIPFLTLGWFVMLREIRDFWVVTAVTMLVSGLGVWLLGSPGWHIGASGLVFGYLGYLLSRGFFERNLPSILLSIIVGVLYGGIIIGVLPIQAGVSWEGHLFGLIGGGIAAWLLSRRPSIP